MRKSEQSKRLDTRSRASATFGVIIAGDMTYPGDRGLRVGQEIRHYAAKGLKVGVLQTSLPSPGRRVSPEIQSCVRRGLAVVVAPADEQEAELLVVHAPAEVDWAKRPLARLLARRTILVCHHVADFEVNRLKQRLPHGEAPSWAPTNSLLRARAPAALNLAPKDWRPFPAADGRPAKPRSAASEKCVGWILSAGSAPPPCDSSVKTMLLDMQSEWDLSLDRIGLLDGLAYFPTRDDVEFPDTIIRAALEHDLPVMLPQWIKPHYGRRARYCEPQEALDGLAAPRRAFGSHNRMGKLGNGAPARTGEQRPVVFVASNGVGIGHLSRLVAVARRMGPRTPVLFATQAQAVAAVERLGFLAHYLPSASYVGGNFETWDEWFRYDLEHLIDAYDAALVVYDGNNPSPGLIRAVTPRRDCRLAWVRRGLWGNLTSPFIDNSRWFDLIVEPGELEGQPDNGITAQRRDEAIVVPPVRLLDESDLLSREDAAKSLELDPARPTVLIQLGAGYNRDVVTLLDQLIGTLQQVPQLQIAIAEWANGAHALNYWPNVTYLRGYPLSQYYRAFDFSVAAAGYNTFHEVISFGLPTVFIPNRHPSMDDQAGRAVYAQELHAAFELDEADLSDLPDIVTLLLDPKARDFLVGNGRTLQRPNGAAEVAQALNKLLEVVQ